MPIAPRYFYLSMLLATLLGRSAPSAEPIKSPLSPEESIAAIELANDATLSLVAAEPQVIDPVAIRFDEQGRLWVVEMHDYPHGPAQGEEPQSRIRILEDRDHDQLYETATTFADHLLFATGIQPWQGGVFATVGGKVIYLKDTDGDLQADVNETWFTGFAEENSQLRANHPRLGFDGWIYVANGLRGGAVVGQQEGDEKLDLRGADFRFHPHTGEYQAVSGPGQFGLSFDDLGNRFVCSNRHPLDQVVLKRKYQRANPLAPAFAPLQPVAAAGADSRVYPISEAWTTSNLHAGQFTAACGLLVNRGNALADRYAGAAFTCDPTGNLVHAESMQPSGATFTAEPMFAEREFLASHDTWFRPVNLENGPGGELYVVDMYRAVIEHPQFMPEELKQRPDLMQGNDLGRIYRIASKDSQGNSPNNAPQSISTATDASELIDLLSHANAWQRETAARLLYEQGVGQQAIEPLTTLIRSDANSHSRLTALHLLHSHDLLADSLLIELLQSKPATRADAAITRQAIELAEPQLAENAELRELVVEKLVSPAATLKFQAALSLASVADFDRTELTRLYHDHANDRWLQRALLIAVGKHGGELLSHLISSTQWEKLDRLPSAPQLATLAELAGMAAAEEESDSMHRLARALGKIPRGSKYLPVRLEVTHSAAMALQRRKQSLSLLKRHADQAIREPIVQVFADAAQVAADSEAPGPLRMGAIELLGFDLEAGNTIETLALKRGNPEVRAAAVKALASQSSLKPWQQLLTDFPRLPPVIRLAVLDGVLRTPQRTHMLLDAVEAGVINLGEIDPLRMRRLQSHSDQEIRSRIKQLLEERYPEDRKQAIAAHRQALGLEANPNKGREVFKKNCAACHRIAGLGQQIGPDISDSRTKTAAQILTDILEPNLAIDANYIGYTVQAADGKVYSGLMQAATDDQITLRIPENNTTVSLARDDIEQLISTGASLMPEGFEKNISLQEMADLISFIKNWRYLDGAVPVESTQ